MTKKNNTTISSPKPENRQTSGDTMNWTATNLLDARDNHQSDMKPEKLEEVKLLFWSSINVVIPDYRSCWFLPEGWVCFYYYPFDIGLTFPFSPFIVDVLKTLNVSLGQLMPFAWRTLACLDAIEEKHHLDINVDVVKHSYSLKKFSSCRIGFVNRNTEEPLILNNETVNDRNWKKSYFFVEKKTLSGNHDYLLDRRNQICMPLLSISPFILIVVCCFKSFFLLASSDFLISPSIITILVKYIDFFTRP